MLEQKFYFSVKDLSLNYHLGKEKCQKALKLYEIWIFKVRGVFAIYPIMTLSEVSQSYPMCVGWKISIFSMPGVYTWGAIFLSKI